jgi:hypothetical protein
VQFLDRVVAAFRGSREAPATSSVDENLRVLLDRGPVPPSQSSLDLLWANTTSIRIRDRGAGTANQVIASVVDVAALVSFAEVLRIVDGDFARCMCMGNLAIEFVGSGGDARAVISLHHGISIRWDSANVWRTDGKLANGEAVLRWLDRRGVSAPLAEYRQAQERHVRDAQEASSWVEASPHVIRHLVSLTLRDQGWAVFVPQRNPKAAAPPPVAPPELETEISVRLRERYRDDKKRAVVLLRWFAAGSGRCSGFPPYEAIPDHLLLEISLPAIVAAVEAERSDPQVVAGAVRHLAGWPSRQARGEEGDAIPADLRKVLLRSALDSGDDDRVARARRAFE